MLRSCFSFGNKYLQQKLDGHGSLLPKNTIIRILFKNFMPKRRRSNLGIETNKYIGQNLTTLHTCLTI